MWQAISTFWGSAGRVIAAALRTTFATPVPHRRRIGGASANAERPAAKEAHRGPLAND
jgi:hypothetical protein